MSPWILLVLSLAFLLGPWVLMPPRRSEAEIRGVFRLLWGINAAICGFWYRLEADQFAPLPEHGPAILISNHTCPIDSMLLQATSRRVLGFLIAREYFEYWAFRPLCSLLGCIPVRRDGQDFSAARAALRALEQGRVVPMFPEGRITPRSGQVLGPPLPGVAFLVLRARVPVIPAYIWGTPATNRLGPTLRTPARAHVMYGPPIDAAELTFQAKDDGRVPRAVLSALSERLMDAIEALRVQARGPDGEGISGRGTGSLEGFAEVATAHGQDGIRRPDGGAGAISGDCPPVPAA
jgi:1-acyl-sn-glycerol-3-phosphate acyltransferase